LKYGNVTQGFWIRSDDPKIQLNEVIEFFYSGSVRVAARFTGKAPISIKLMTGLKKKEAEIEINSCYYFIVSKN